MYIIQIGFNDQIISLLSIFEWGTYYYSINLIKIKLYNKTFQHGEVVNNGMMYLVADLCTGRVRAGEGGLTARVFLDATFTEAVQTTRDHSSVLHLCLAQ